MVLLSCFSILITTSPSPWQRMSLSMSCTHGLADGSSLLKQQQKATLVKRTVPLLTKRNAFHQLFFILHLIRSRWVGACNSWSIFSTPFLLWQKGSSGPVTQGRQSVSCDWSWHSHGSLIPGKFDLKINRSIKTPWQEYSGIACSYQSTPTLIHYEQDITYFTMLKVHFSVLLASYTTI